MENIETTGLIGAGHIGMAVARLAVAAGYYVAQSSSRGPATLTYQVTALGPRSSADTAEGAAPRGDLVVVTIPLKAIGDVPVEPLAGKVVLDTNNYYPERDGRIERLDAQQATSTGLLQEHLPTSKVVKAFNHISAPDLATQAAPAGAPGRRALSLFGDDADAVDLAARWLDELGYDAVRGGTLADSWRIEPGTPGYGAEDDADQLRAHLAAATRG